MAGRASLDDRLGALRALKGRELTAEERAAVRKAIGDRSNLIVAAAAGLAGENSLRDCAPDMEVAFDRFLKDPVKHDKLCRAKLAIVQTLDQMEHPEPEVFRKAATHVQMEPVWGSSEDTAAPLRAAALLALTRIEGTFALPLLVDAFADAEKDVRSAAAVALGALGTETSGLLLRLKVRLGDDDPDVLAECLGGLLKVDLAGSLPLVSEYLDPMDAPRCEAAALALGRSRRIEALEPLQTLVPRIVNADLRAQVLLCVALLRLREANEFLIDLVENEPEPFALAALAALQIHKGDPKVRDRVAEVVNARKNPQILATFQRNFATSR